jgi:hypothetical protein
VVRVGLPSVPRRSGIEEAQPSGVEFKMHVIAATTEAAAGGLEAVYRDAIWLVARATSPDAVLRYDPRLALEEADFFAAQRCFWIVERHGILVAHLRWSYAGKASGCLRIEPELIEIAACPGAWKSLPVWVHEAVWRRLLTIIYGHEPLAHDRPELRRLAETSFRATVKRAIGNQGLLEELFAACPFWSMSREQLLEQDPSELRLWHRLLRLPKDEAVRSGIIDFLRALRHAAGLIRATTNPYE